jgi:hypothetical protein
MIKNIKKQESQIQNILNDMKYVQKEINNLSGKIERSFTVTEQTISAVSVLLVCGLHTPPTIMYRVSF